MQKQVFRPLSCTFLYFLSSGNTFWVISIAKFEFSCKKTQVIFSASNDPRIWECHLSQMENLHFLRNFNFWWKKNLESGQKLPILMAWLNLFSCWENVQCVKCSLSDLQVRQNSGNEWNWNAVQVVSLFSQRKPQNRRWSINHKFQLSSLKDGGDLLAFTTFTLSHSFLENVICQCCVIETNVTVRSAREQYTFFDPHDITQI